jgi:phosphotransferase system enzyme I (PtsI)
VTNLTLRGKPISPGFAQGHAFLLGQVAKSISSHRIRAEEVDGELTRFHQALNKSRAEIQRLSDRVQSELGSVEAGIFSAHLLFLEDRQFIERVEGVVRRDLVCVESAVRDAVGELAQILEEADNEYLRERQEDLRDLERRVLRHITQGDTSQFDQIRPGAVLVAREILPSELLGLDRQHLAGIVTEVGGEAGHAAILARALGVPAVTGIPEATRLARSGLQVLLNGKTGEVVFDPSSERIAAFARERIEYERSAQRAATTDRLECVTRDGLRVHLHANIGREHEAELVVKHGLDGVGLFRTEYLFLDDPEEPSLERHEEIYRRVASKLQGRPLVIRTLDLGGDKFPTFLAPRFEANPNLGIRGLRFSLLAAEDLFRTQIKAIVRLSGEFDVRILLPMVLGGSDMGDAVALIGALAMEEGVRDLPPVGALIETPSAVFSIEDILRQADFVSLGTNDLTQFILAADRNALATIDDYTALHPSVLRAMRQVIRAAAVAGKGVSVCGEAAADARFACLLVGLGSYELSMNPISSSRVRFAIRAMTDATLKEIVDKALAADSPQRVSSLLDDSLGERLGDLLAGQASALEMA